jgi:hypothetical protein
VTPTRSLAETFMRNTPSSTDQSGIGIVHARFAHLKVSAP